MLQSSTKVLMKDPVGSTHVLCIRPQANIETYIIPFWKDSQMIYVDFNIYIWEVPKTLGSLSRGPYALKIWVYIGVPLFTDA